MLSEVDKDDLHITQDIQVNEGSQISQILSYVVSIHVIHSLLSTLLLILVEEKQ